MMVVTENVPPALRGRLALWLVEIRSGVYVGIYSAKVREYIWETISAGMVRSKGNVIMVWKDRTDLGFSLKTMGTCQWHPIDFDGVTLMGFAGDNCK
jgi:CRISPR-associated protein Cas2